MKKKNKWFISGLRLLLVIIPFALVILLISLLVQYTIGKFFGQMVSFLLLIFLGIPYYNYLKKRDLI